MFFKAPGKPTKLKKAVYLLASIILGLLLSVILHALIEVNYIIWAIKHNYIMSFYGGCTLPPILQATILLAGLVGGYLLGLFWWDKVYVKRVWFRHLKRR